MKYSTFANELTKLGFDLSPNRRTNPSRDYVPMERIEYIPETNPDRSWWDDDVLYVPALLLKWETGGTHGEGDYQEGSGRAIWYPSDTLEPSWEDLDTILEHFCPAITYLRYRKLERLVKSFTRTDNGYYGDSTTYAIKALYLKELWQFLQTHKLFEEK